MRLAALQPASTVLRTSSAVVHDVQWGEDAAIGVHLFVGYSYVNDDDLLFKFFLVIPWSLSVVIGVLFFYSES